MIKWHFYRCLFDALFEYILTLCILQFMHNLQFILLRRTFCGMLYIYIYIYIYDKITCPSGHHHKDFITTGAIAHKCTSCHRAIMMMTRRACCIKTTHMYYAHRSLLGFEHSFFLLDRQTDRQTDR